MVNFVEKIVQEVNCRIAREGKKTDNKSEVKFNTVAVVTRVSALLPRRKPTVRLQKYERQDYQEIC
jgi:hypothetical protein